VQPITIWFLFIDYAFDLHQYIIGIERGMFMAPTSKIIANGVEIGVIKNDDVGTFLSLTDIARYKNQEDPRIIVTNWMSSYSTADFLAVWEEIHNPSFNRLEFQSVRREHPEK